MTALLIGLAIALAAGALLAALMLRDPGYVLLSYDGMTLETSLWFAVGVLAALGFSVWALFYLVRRFRRAAGWLRSRRAGSARAQALQGTMLLAEGRWQEAEDALLSAAAKVDTPLDSYLNAARAANQAGRHEDRDRILGEAREALPEAAFVIDLVKSELQQARGEWQASIATLEVLRRQAPRHPVVLQRLFEAHRALEDWQAALDLAPAFDAEFAPDMAAVQAKVWSAKLAESTTAAQAGNVWKVMPKALRDDEELLLRYVDALAGNGAAGDAEAILRQGLKRNWRPAWVRRYGALPGDAEGRLGAASGWLNEHPNDAALLLTLGRLAAQTGDAAAARGHLEASLRIESHADTLLALAALSESTGDVSGANAYYRQALEEGNSSGVQSG